MRKHELATLELDAEIRLRLADERRPAASVDGDYADVDDADTLCIDGDGREWPEHDESGYAECRRCGAELEV